MQEMNSPQPMKMSKRKTGQREWKGANNGNNGAQGGEIPLIYKST